MSVILTQQQNTFRARAKKNPNNIQLQQQAIAPVLIITQKLLPSHQPIFREPWPFSFAAPVYLIRCMYNIVYVLHKYM